MANNEFKILIDSLRIAMSEDDRKSIEKSVNAVLNRYTKNWKEDNYSSQNLKKLYYQGLNKSAAQKIRNAGIDENYFRKYVDGFSDTDKEIIAEKLQVINDDDPVIEIKMVPYSCVNLLSRLVKEAITGQQKKPSKGGLAGYLSKTVSSDSFASVFKEIAKSKLPAIRNNSDIHAFILKPEIFPFSYSKLENLILENITNYAISRGVNKSDVAGIKATKILRDYAHSGVPENIMGEMLTYIFLEHIDNANKIYTRAEISAHSRPIDSEGIYLKDNQGILQLILGASQLHDNLQRAIDNVISELRSFKNNQSVSLIESTELVDRSILNEQYSPEISEKILDALIPEENKVDEIAAYGLFIGYKFDPDINLSDCSIAETKDRCEKVIKQDLNRAMLKLDDEIKANKWQKSSFYVYMLPFISAENDGDKIMGNIIGGYDYAGTR